MVESPEFQNFSLATAEEFSDLIQNKIQEARRKGIEEAATLMAQRASDRHGWDKHGDVEAIRQLAQAPTRKPALRS